MVSKSSNQQRVCIPNLLSGEFSGLIIGTFGASLDFAERQLFSQLSRSTLNRVILVDGRQLNKYFSSGAPLRKINRSYIACPVLTSHAHHPKFIFLVGPNRGRLIVGSGNLSISGYAGPGECFVVHEWSVNSDTDSLQPFLSLKEMIFDQIDLGLIDRITASRVRDIFDAGNWINGDPTGNSIVIHNSKQSLIDQFVTRVNGCAVIEIVASAPFHDQSAKAVDALLTEFKPLKFSLLVQNKVTRLNVRSLTRVFSKHSTKIQIVEAEAPEPYGKTFLHAKFILVRTKTKDFLLQGSANLSAVALCESGPKANVELSNLLVGEPGEFDYLIDDLKLEIRKDGLTKFEPDLWDSDDLNEEQFSNGPRDVCWRPPILTGWVPKEFGPKVNVRLGERDLRSKNETSEKLESGYEFSIEFSEASSERVSQATFIQLLSKDNQIFLVAPYHIDTLQRLSASGNRADLLQEVGDMNLEDREIEELIAELDRVLIIDSRSIWRLTHVEDHATNDEDPIGVLNYSELDWARIGELPQLRQYGSASQRLVFGSSDLGLILQSLTNRLKLEARGKESSAVDVSDTNFANNSELDDEDPEQVDENSDTSDDDFNAERNPTRRRVKTLWKNFLKRFISGFSDPNFIELVGSTVVIPTYVLVNHLCRRLRTLEMVDIEFLNKTQIQLWEFMWGSETNIGYLESLSGEEKKVARRILQDHDDFVVTIVSVVDAWWDIWSKDLTCLELRSTWHKILENESWKPDRDCLNRASRISVQCDGDKDQLFNELFELASYHEVSELNRAISLALGVPVSSLCLATDTVMRSGVRQTCTYIDLDCEKFTLQMACDGIKAWKSIETERIYFRLQSSTAVAILDEEFHEEVFFDKATGDEIALELGDQEVPEWEKNLNKLFV